MMYKGGKESMVHVNGSISVGLRFQATRHHRI